MGGERALKTELGPNPTLYPNATPSPNPAPTPNQERALKTELLLRRGVRGGASPTAGMIISGLGKVSEEAGLPPTEAAGSPKPGLKPTSHFGLRKVAGGGGSGMGSIGKALQGSAAKEQVLAADEKESTFATAGGRPLVATSNLHDEDVFGLQLVRYLVITPQEASP